MHRQAHHPVVATRIRLQFVTLPSQRSPNFTSRIRRLRGFHIIEQVNPFASTDRKRCENRYENQELFHSHYYCTRERPRQRKCRVSIP
ncbi:MAG: hypothetical protein BWY82_02706 [Verrucomicrobia bacterium ADurb.Bin474]|nr:MAG: hypothetical protein BWY82_02706 [Verrucomicrobia bacterium ADurb.Bin474]